MSTDSGYSFRVYFVVHAVINFVQVKHEYDINKGEEAMALAIAYKKAGFMVQLQRMTARTEFTKDELHIPGAPNESRL